MNGHNDRGRFIEETQESAATESGYRGEEEDRKEKLLAAETIQAL